jgi:hypothetical protein
MTLLAVLPGCGRIDFDPLRAADAAIDTTTLPTRCDPQAPFTTITRMDSVDTLMIEGGARLNADETTIYFHSDRSGLYKLWSATRARRDLPFEPATIAMPTGDCLWPTLTSNELTVVYSTIDLFTSTRGSVSEPFPGGTLIASLNGASNTTNPFLGPLGTTLYFTTYDPEGNFYTAPWPGLASAQPIIELNTAGREEAPVLSADEHVIYFSRDAGNGPDIFIAQRDSSTGSFGPAALVPELNSMSDDKATWLSPDHCRLYFESGREASFDIFVAERTP